MIFYFSGTGNSKWVAQQLSKSQNEELVFIPSAINEGIREFSLTEKEKIGFVFPVYSWAPPAIVLQFIKSLSFAGYRQQYMFFVCTCGDDTGLMQNVFEKAVAAKGWKCHAGFSVIMPNSYVSLPGFDVDAKMLENKKLNEAVPRLSELNDVINRRESVFSCNEGSYAFLKTRIISPLFNRFMTSPKAFRVTDACISCRRCEKACPVGNVVIENEKPVWGTNCTACLACYHVCPQQAVQYGNKTRNKGQYYNPNV